jgi:hypothetical protein
MRISELGCVIVINLLAFQMYFQDAYGGAFSYIDEAACILLAVASLKYRGGIEPAVRGSLILLALLVVEGLVGTIANQIQLSSYAITIDVLTCSKFIVAVAALFLILGSIHLTEAFVSMLQVEAKLIIAIVALCGCISLYTDIGMNTDEVRFGLKSFEFIFSHPEVVNLLMVGLIAILCSSYRRNRFWMLLALLPMVLTLRTKAIGFAILASILILGISSFHRSWKFVVALLVLVILVVAWSQITNYYENDAQARNQLLNGGLLLANRYFPLGTGFATYGSAITAQAEFYSPLYESLGLSTIYGLSVLSSSFISDTFWPILLGQFGWAGTLLYAGSIFLLLKAIYAKAFLCNASGDVGPFLAMLITFAYLFISSLASSAFFAPMSIYLAVCLMITVSYRLDTDDVEDV